MMAKESETSEEKSANVVADTEETASPQDSEALHARRQFSGQQNVGLLEALLLASGDPLSIARVEEILGCSKGEVLELVGILQRLCTAEDRGVEVILVAEKLQLRTKALYADYVRQLMAVRPRRLSQAALETLAVIAYQQPVVKSEIDKIRGVDVAPTIKTLLERNLVKIIGYQASVGQPSLYGTTEDFLKVFGLSSLAALPAMRDLKALAKEPGEALEGNGAPEPEDVDGLEVEEPIPAELPGESGETAAQ